MRRPRRNHTAAFKAKAALAALKDDKMLAERCDVHGDQITQWKTQLLDGAIDVFLTPAEKRGTENGCTAKEMQAKIGQNGADESANAKFCDECLSIEWFRSCTETRVLIEIWRRHYNDVRPHSSLEYRTPAEFRRHYESTHQGAILK